MGSRRCQMPQGRKRVELKIQKLMTGSRTRCLRSMKMKLRYCENLEAFNKTHTSDKDVKGQISGLKLELEALRS
ncbi:hypothetical protein Patl1_10750 [Pistacia atlantica]|uniref:Uncharacterized protein n=1 Tax=Pistacia atlantica TaxID=434234 RepID=A0ACC1A8E6_9ROSI|nr:hypothetical protein Patl1_10750 [Pistacia atlantica]